MKKRRKYEHHGMVRTRLYKCWDHMCTRARGTCGKQYYITNPHYRGGLPCCKAWLNSFIAFMKWSLSHGYADDLSIDRIDNSKGYFPSNCRWATTKEQQENTCRVKPLKIDGNVYPSIHEAARQLGVPRITLQRRIARGGYAEILTVAEARKALGISHG